MNIECSLEPLNELVEAFKFDAVRHLVIKRKDIEVSALRRRSRKMQKEKNMNSEQMTIMKVAIKLIQPVITKII